MGCGTSATTVVEPVHCNELTNDEDETESKLGSRGDSAVSKVTADSGVVMEGPQDPALPGTVPSKIPPLTGSPGLLQDLGSHVERPLSSEILEQLLNQGIIPVGSPKERSSGPGDVYNMLDDGEVPRQRPPARLESLKERKEQSSSSRDSIDHEMQQVEERKQKEDELQTRLRTKSARVRAPIAIMAESEDQDPKEDQPLQTPTTSVTPEPLDPTKVRKDGRGATEGSERGLRDGPGEGREEREEEEEKKDEGGDHRGMDEEGQEAREEGSLGGCGEREGGDGSPVQDEGLQMAQLLTTSGEFESDPSFQNTPDIF